MAIMAPLRKLTQSEELMYTKLFKWVTAIVAFTTMPVVVVAESGFTDVLNMSEGVTPLSESIFGIHMLVFWICVAIGIICLLYTSDAADD